MHLCVVQEERIELLDKLEQFPLKIRVKEEQESILRWAPFLHLFCTRNVYAPRQQLWCCIYACQQESILRLAGCCVFSALITSVPMSMEILRCCISSWAAFCTDVSALVPVSRF